MKKLRLLSLLLCAALLCQMAVPASAAETGAAKAARTSVLGKLKVPSVHGAGEKKKSHEQEAR